MNRLLSLLALLGLMLFAAPAPACGLVGASAVQYGYGMQLAQAQYYQMPQLALPQLAQAPYCPPLVLQTPQLAVPQEVEIPQLPQLAPAPYCAPALGLTAQSYGQQQLLQAPLQQYGVMQQLSQVQSYQPQLQLAPQVGYGTGVQLNIGRQGRFFRGGTGFQLGLNTGVGFAQNGVFLNTVDPVTGLVIDVGGRRGGRGVGNRGGRRGGRGVGRGTRTRSRTRTRTRTR